MKYQTTIQESIDAFKAISEYAQKIEPSQHREFIQKSLEQISASLSTRVSTCETPRDPRRAEW